VVAVVEPGHLLVVVAGLLLQGHQPLLRLLNPGKDRIMLQMLTTTEQGNEHCCFTFFIIKFIMAGRGFRPTWNKPGIGRDLEG
jgi:hypothetical protein